MLKNFFLLAAFSLIIFQTVPRKASNSWLSPNERLVYGKIEHINEIKGDHIIIVLTNTETLIGQPIESPTFQVLISKYLLNKYSSEKTDIQEYPEKWVNRKVLLLIKPYQDMFTVSYSIFQQQFTFIPDNNSCYLLDNEDEVHYLPSLRKLTLIQTGETLEKSFQEFVDDSANPPTLRLFAAEQWLAPGLKPTESLEYKNQFNSLKKLRDDNAIPVYIRSRVNDMMYQYGNHLFNEDIEDFIRRRINDPTATPEERKDFEKRLEVLLQNREYAKSKSVVKE